MSFEGGRGYLAERCVAGLVAGVEFEVSELLDLEGCEDAFGRGVVPAVAMSGDAADDAGACSAWR